ncbi:homoserine dehydrogenase [Chloroflexus aggregans]|uniref:Homoserine dehydrogenase n=1 Tax=Chloroflexus aggregans (strain MD-66 / DSM 9485) TaxID=326427 RepID=B8G441_CHLAD|nr:homoserine dehydrogenase [Chloroflexus aggregans]ACL25443.1 Homoserine dehydrogenase [Chloroflexus aggregans DSM 9485]
MVIVNTIVTGLGNIGRTLLELLARDPDRLLRRYGFTLRIVGVADSTGVALDPAGLDPSAVIAAKRQGLGARSLSAFRPDLDVVALAATAAYDLLLEATPTNLRDGQPALDIVRAALRRGKPAVLASKGPLVLAFAELAALSDWADDLSPRSPRPALRFSGAVGGALPTINFGCRDLAGAQIERAELVVNSTTQVILEQMAAGADFATALAEAQRQGIVEPDSSLDVDGWDAANKLVIFANAVLRQPTTLSDVTVRGIREVTTADLAAAWGAGGRVSLVALAERQPDGRYALSVAPTVLGREHPLARLARGEMGFVIYTDTAGRSTISSLEDGPLGTCQAMVRDVIEIMRR